LCGPADSATYDLAVLLEEDGRGGSRHIHATVKPGMELRLRGPHNLFRLDETAPHYTLIAGGIGITPIIAMADRLKALGKDYVIHYCGRSRAAMAHLARLEQDHSGRVSVHAKDEGQRADLAGIVAGLSADGQIYACGPERMICALEELTAHHPQNTLHVEYFTPASTGLDPDQEHALEVELADSDLTLQVAADQTVLEAILAAGIDIACDCREGLCGSCEVAVLEGEVDHRDRVLSKSERARSTRMMTCCSRSVGGKPLKLAL